MQATTNMSQAKTLTPAEIDHVLAHIAQRSYALRNRVMLLTGLWSGMRVGEIASLSVCDVVNTDGTIRAEVRLTAEQTKGRHPRMAQHFHYLFKRAGIAGASSHSMRRSFITNLATKGIGVRVLASLAGHRSIAITQRYIDVNDDMKRRAVELV